MPNASAFFRPATPLHMVWLSTDACNARCLHCSSDSSLCSSDELDTGEVLGMIDQFVELGVLDMAVSGGEPLLRPDLFKILDYATRRLTVGVGSNGGKLTSGQARRLAATGINRFQVSLDGPRDAHERLRCWPGLFDRALETIERASAAGLRIHVCCTINRLNFEKLDEFVAIVATTEVRRINFSRFVPTGRGSSALDLSDADWEQVIRWTMLLRDEYSDRLEVTTHLAQQILVDRTVECMPGFTGCQAGSGQGCVTANGNVLPCVLLPIIVGNIRERGLREIWTSSRVMRDLQSRDGLEGACGTCTLQSRCGGCRAVAWAKTGNYLATDPRCWLPPRQSALFSILS